MGYRYRKSVKVGKYLRINFSRSGIGYSFGTKGYRVTKTAKGTIRQTSSIPGTGLSYVTEKKLAARAAAPEKTPEERLQSRAKKTMIWAVVLYVLALLFHGETFPWIRVVIASALLAWSLWDRRKIKDPERPVAETSDEDE
mgnify:FL=1